VLIHHAEDVIAALEVAQPIADGPNIIADMYLP